MAFRSAQLANFLNTKPELIRSWIYRGKLNAKKHYDNYHYLFEKEDIARFLLQNPEYLNKFLNCNPKKIYKDSYDILHKEVMRQYTKYYK